MRFVLHALPTLFVSVARVTQSHAGQDLLTGGGDFAPFFVVGLGACCAVAVLTFGAVILGAIFIAFHVRNSKPR